LIDDPEVDPFWDELVEGPREAAPVELVPKEPAVPAELARSGGGTAMRAVVDEIFEEAAANIAGVMKFSDIDQQNPDVVPQAWIEAHGQEKAEKMHRLALMGLSNSRNAPVGIKTAQQVFTGIMKARENKGNEYRQLNMIFVRMESHAPKEYPEEEWIEDGDR
jgi:hypothetical protein